MEGEKTAFVLFGGAFCDPVLYGTRAREPVGYKNAETL